MSGTAPVPEGRKGSPPNSCGPRRRERILSFSPKEGRGDLEVLATTRATKRKGVGDRLGKSRKARRRRR